MMDTMPAATSPAPASATASGTNPCSRTWARTPNPAAATRNPPAITRGRPSRSESFAASGAAPPTAIAGRTLHRAATSGSRPSTDCRNWVMTTELAISENVPIRLTRMDPPTWRSSRARMSMSGCFRRSCRAVKRMPKTMPAARMASGRGAHPSSAMVFTPYVTGRMLASTSTELIQSILGRAELFDSGSSVGATISSRTIAGMLIRNTEPQKKFSSSRPLMTGPIVTPLAITALHTDIALTRCFASGNIVRIRARVEGIKVEPATPRTARARISTGAEGANAASSELSPKPAAGPVAYCAHRQQQAGQHETVDVEDPQLLDRARAQVLGDERRGEEQDGHVHRHDHQRQAEHAQRDPLPPACRAARMGAGSPRDQLVHSSAPYAV